MGYRKAVDQGDAEAQLNRDFIHRQGQGGSQSSKGGLVGYRKAADREANAQCNMGVVYYQGQGVHQSFEEAAVWYRKRLGRRGRRRPCCTAPWHVLALRRLPNHEKPRPLCAVGRPVVRSKKNSRCAPRLDSGQSKADVYPRRAAAALEEGPHGTWGTHARCRKKEVLRSTGREERKNREGLKCPRTKHLAAQGRQ